MEALRRSGAPRSCSRSQLGYCLPPPPPILGPPTLDYCLISELWEGKKGYHWRHVLGSMWRWQPCWMMPPSKQEEINSPFFPPQPGTVKHSLPYLYGFNSNFCFFRVYLITSQMRKGQSLPLLKNGGPRKWWGQVNYLKFSHFCVVFSCLLCTEFI